MSTLYKVNVQPVKGSAFTLELMGLTSQADTDIFQTSVTLAAGDVTLFGDGAALGNITTLPTEIGTTGVLTISLSALEMAYDRIGIRFHDAAGSQWVDCGIWFSTVTAVTVSDFDDTADSVIVGSIANDAITAASITADAGTEIGTAVWASATRTLTQSAASITTTVGGASLTIHRGDTLNATITGLASNTGYVSLLFTVKRDKNDADSDAIIQIRKNASGSGDGLMYLNGAAPVAPVVAADGSITVNSATSLTFILAARATDDLAPVDNYVYDIELITATAVTTISEGVCDITADVTRAIA
jgi:hypothetical protein